MFKWLMGANAAPTAARHALRSVAVALTALAVDRGLLAGHLGDAVLAVLRVPFGS